MPAGKSGRVRKRGHGEGSIYYSEDKGLWVGQLRTEFGRKTVYGQTRQVVQQKLAEVRRGVESGLAPAPERQTVGQYLKAWLQTVEPTVRTSTWDRHESDLRLHIIPRIGHVRLTKLTAQQVQWLYAECLRYGLATTTVNHLHGRLHKALDAAVRLGLVVRNVADLVDPPSVAHHEMSPLTRDEARAFLERTQQDRYGPIYGVAIATGLRMGELLALRWEDVDLDGRSLQVKRSVRFKPRVGFVWSDAKTRRSRRRVVYSAQIAEVFRAHRVKQLGDRLMVGPGWEDNGLVFCTTMGRPIAGGNLLKGFQRALAHQGLARRRFHDLRHTAATLLLLGKVNPKVVSEMLGHASVSITLDLYSHVLPDMQQDAAEVMASVLFGWEV